LSLASRRSRTGFMGFPFAKKKKKPFGGSARELSDATEERLIALTPSTLTSGALADGEDEADGDDSPDPQPRAPRMRSFFMGRRRHSESVVPPPEVISKPNSTDETTTITTAGTPATHSTVTPYTDDVPLIERLSITEVESGRIEVFTPESRQLAKNLFATQQSHSEGANGEADEEVDLDIGTSHTSDSALDDRNSRADDKTAPINNRHKSQYVDAALPDYNVKIISMGRSISRSEFTRESETLTSEEDTLNRFSPQRDSLNDSLTQYTDPSKGYSSDNQAQAHLFGHCVPPQNDMFSEGYTLSTHSKLSTFDEDTADSVEDTTKSGSINPNTNTRSNLLDPIFQCGDTTSVFNFTGGSNVDPVTKRPFNIMHFFYDPFCSPQDIKDKPKRPYYDERFTLRFLAEMLGKGVSLLYLHPPGTPGNYPPDDWKGRSVIMKIEQGNPEGDSHTIQPKLTWSNMPGGKVSRRFTITMCLLKVLSISTQVEEMNGDSDDGSDDMCFFTITTTSGEVHMFEAASSTQKDKIAAGLRNVIARLTFHLIAGDPSASSELYSNDAPDVSSGELPPLPSPHQNMNRIAHAMLDG
jgi:hypothetical protein